jgi:hypothetical protein
VSCKPILPANVKIGDLRVEARKCPRPGWLSQAVERPQNYRLRRGEPVRMHTASSKGPRVAFRLEDGRNWGRPQPAERD